MNPGGKVIRLRGGGEYAGGPAWNDAEMVEMLNSEQIVALWITHIFAQQRSADWRPLAREAEIRNVIDRWHGIFDVFVAAQGDADTLRTLRHDLLVHARRVRLMYEQMPE